MNESQIDEQHELAVEIQKFLINHGYNTRLSTTTRDGYMHIRLFDESKTRRYGVQLGIGPAPEYRVFFLWDSGSFRDTLDVRDTEPMAEGGFADRIASHATRSIQVYTDIARLLEHAPWKK